MAPSCLSSGATHGVEDEDGAELDEAVQGHVPKETEGCDQRTPALSAQGEEKMGYIFIFCLKKWA